MAQACAALPRIRQLADCVELRLDYFEEPFDLDVLLGERGKGKTRLIRTIVGLLDEWTPVIAGAELHEHPYHPITPASLRRAAERETDTARIASMQKADDIISAAEREAVQVRAAADHEAMKTRAAAEREPLPVAEDAERPLPAGRRYGRLLREVQRIRRVRENPRCTHYEPERRHAHKKRAML